MLDRAVVVVLGMHRSGTSMIGGVLTCLGIDLGEDYPGKQLSNPLGHFEEREFLELNERILKAAGGSWASPPSPDKILDTKEQFADEIAKMIRFRMDQHQQTLWGWKDPRTSLTIELFSPYLDQLHILWCQRNPQEIAESLLNRNHIEVSKGLHLTQIYQDRIEAFVTGNPQFQVLRLPYQEIVQHPDIWIPRIIEFLNLQPTAKQTKSAVSFVLPAEKLQKQRVLLWIKLRITLPVRALRKIFKTISVNVKS